MIPRWPCEAAMLDLLALPGDEHALMFRIGAAGNGFEKPDWRNFRALSGTPIIAKRLYFALADGTDRLGTDLESMFAAHRKVSFDWDWMIFHAATRLPHHLA